MSDSPMFNTGFSSISRDLINRLNKKPQYDCKYLGHNYQGQALTRGTKFIDGSELDFELHGGGMKPFAQDVMSWWIKQQKLDVFGVLLDTFMLYGSDGWFLRQDTSPAKTIMYFPSDGEACLPINCENILRKVDMPVAMSKFAKKQAWDVYKIKTEYIPHAVDQKLFFPFTTEERIALKAKWGLKNKFVVGTVARNQPRKMLDRTFKAFKIFAEGKDDVVLFLHSDPNDISAVFDSYQLMMRYNIQNKVLFSGVKYFRGLPYKEMNSVYNIMDVHFLSTSGEGFGVPTIEAAACGIPSVVTDITTTQELLVEDGECGLPVKCLGGELDTLTGSWNVERGVMDILDAAKQLQKLYDDAKLRAKLGENGVKKVEKFYDWEKVADDWDRLIREKVMEL
ncbi:MAG: glycosyltransferase family 4 protein [Candidatus Paceibacterota bacterium]